MWLPFTLMFPATLEHSCPLLPYWLPQGNDGLQAEVPDSVLPPIGKKEEGGGGGGGGGGEGAEEERNGEISTKGGP